MPDPASTARTAYLLWSPGFGRSLLASAIAELAVLATVASVPAARELADDAVAAAQFALLESVHSLRWWSAIAMLASACCVIQVILTALAVGCSGLNAVLGPLRPPLLVATALLQAGSWFVVLTRKPDQAASVGLGTALALALSLSPELVAMFSARGGRPREPAAGRTVTLRLRKVSCSVCASKVVALAEAVPAVARCDVDIDSAEATLCLADDADADAASEEAARALAEGGYALAGDGGGQTAHELPDAVCAATSPAARPPAAGSLWMGVLGGLAGSSCCAIQLGLNLLLPALSPLLAQLPSLGLRLQAGCMGFNTHLGPLRPYARAATGTLFAVRWAASVTASRPPRRQARRPLLLATLLAAALTYLPEALVLSGTHALAPPSEGALRVVLRVGGMGCEGCQHAARGVLFASPGVLDARVHGTDEAGEAELLLQPEGWGWDLRGVAARMEAAGFDVDEQAAAAAIAGAQRGTRAVQAG